MSILFKLDQLSTREGSGRRQNLGLSFLTLISVALITSLLGCRPSTACKVKQISTGQMMVLVAAKLQADSGNITEQEYERLINRFPKIELSKVQVNETTVFLSERIAFYRRRGWPSVAKVKQSQQPRFPTFLATPEVIGCGTESVVYYSDGVYEVVALSDASLQYMRRELLNHEQ